MVQIVYFKYTISRTPSLWRPSWYLVPRISHDWLFFFEGGSLCSVWIWLGCCHTTSAVTRWGGIDSARWDLTDILGVKYVSPKKYKSNIKFVQMFFDITWIRYAVNGLLTCLKNGGLSWREVSFNGESDPKPRSLVWLGEFIGDVSNHAESSWGIGNPPCQKMYELL